VSGITLRIAPGEKIALVGPSGAGKSTLARLLLGLHVPTTGRIRFDEIDLKEIDLPRLRRQAGVVLQETTFFNDSVRANLSLNDPDLPPERLREAAAIACIDNVIDALPDGYETLMGADGNIFSGGERQRLAIARALAHDPAILLLDEATRALDLETEARLHANLAARRCTRILISHRLATVEDADRIVVMHGGRIVQIGTFDELSARDGVFRELVLSAEHAYA
jgi:ABC-type bacteriocin/lantibiotic exporter with double-glycine peptidase domain